MYMKRKTILLALVAVFQSLCLQAQELSAPMQAAYEACLQMSRAVGAGNQTGLRDAGKAYKACDIHFFSSLRHVQGEQPSVDGHFVFTDEFVDSLIAGREVYKFARRYARNRSVRAGSSSGKILGRTCTVAQSSSVKYTFRSRDRQELAVVAEPGGTITLRIHDKTHDKWYNDKTDVKAGAPSRQAVFDLPPNENSTIELEVINTSKKDISFIVISN
jgi:hypothetical protein